MKNIELIKNEKRIVNFINYRRRYKKMNRPEYYPEIRVFEGKGVIKSIKKEIKLDFKLVIYPHTIRIFSDCNLGAFLDCFEWSFQGEIDEDRIVSASSILLVSTSNLGLEFAPLKEVVIGESDNNQIINAKFPLIGYYNDIAEFNYEGCFIKIIGNKQKAEKHERLSKIWKTQLEGFNIEISGEGLSREEYLGKAISITDLLSLATGNQIGFNCQLYFDLNNNESEIWRAQHLDDFGVYPCVPSFEISKFLSNCFPNWIKLNEVERKTIRVAVNYINSTAIGYIEERILRIAQAWELVSTDWIGDNNDLAPEIEDLKFRLKILLKQWRSENPEGDRNGFLTTRVISALLWDKSIKKSEKLAAKFQINLGVINLDLRKLFEDRNSVAHSGRFLDYSENRIPLLDSAVFGLQLILLRKLGYKGLVQTGENGWTTFKKIEEFIKKN